MYRRPLHCDGPPTVTDLSSRSDAWPHSLAPCTSVGLRFFHDIDFRSPCQDCSEILVELCYGRGSVRSGEREQTSPPGNFGHNKTMPDDRSVLTMGAQPLGIRHIPTSDPEHERVSGAHEAPAPVLVEDRLNGVASLPELLLQPNRQLPSVAAGVDFGILARLNLEQG